MTNDTVNTYPQYLPDKPIGIDKFDGGSQESLSKAIVKHILARDNEAQNSILPRIIGIEGSWGSGKSNVVKLVQKQLKGEKYHFFEYDAWGNQEDLQRRSLLEQLTDNLITEKILIGDTTIKVKGGGTQIVDWNKKLKLLLARKVETTIESYPRISDGMIVSGLTILGTCITSFIGNTIHDEYGGLISTIITFLPIIIALIIWGIACLCNERYRSISYLLAIYQDKVSNQTEYEVISEEEPSVVEFKSWMNDVSNGLNKKLCKKLVIVFDNMDRLPEEKVKQLWSSIHTFFAENGFNNIWVIIPFDEEHLSCAFGEEKEKSLTLTRHFINKTFPVTFSVPTPIITDYKKIFRDLFNEAFGTTFVTDEDLINRIYRIIHTKANIRDIIIFINNLVSLYLIWGNQLKLSNIAIYLLHKDKIQNNRIEAILTGEYLGTIANIIEVDEDFKSEIAALTFGVNKHKAKEIPLTEYINNCIDEKNNFDINKFSETDSSFDSILREVIDNTDLAKNALIIKCLSKLQKTNSEVQQIWDDLGHRLLKNKFNELSLPEEYKLAIEKTTTPVGEKIVKKICNIWQNVSDFKGADYVKNIYLLEVLVKDKIAVPTPNLKVSPDAFIDAIRIAKNDYKRFNFIVSPDDVDELLSQKMTNDFTDSEVVQILSNDKFHTFDKLKEKIEELIVSETIESKNLGHICSVYRNINKDKAKTIIGQNHINKLIDDLENEGKLGIEDGYIDLLSMAMSINQRINFDAEYIPQITLLIDYYADYGELLVNNLAWGNGSLNLLLKYMIENNLGKVIDLEQVLQNFNNIINQYDVTGEELLANLEKWNSEFANIKENYIDTDITQLLPKEIYQYTSVSDTILAKSINKFAIETLSNRTKEELIRTEKNYNTDYWHRMINEFLKSLNYSEYLPLCVEEYAKYISLDIAKGTNKLSNDYFKRIANNISSLNKSGIFPEIRDLYCNHHATINEAIFVLFEERLRIYGELLQRKKEVVDTILKPIIRYKAVKDIIINNSEFYKNLFNGITLDNTFKQTISDYWNDETGLHHILGITLNGTEK